MTDTNCDPDLIDWVIPSNDDAIRSVKLIAAKVADAVLEAQNERQARLDQEFEEAEALPPVDETILGEETADYSAALAAGEALVFEPEPEDDEDEERRARARRTAESRGEDEETALDQE